MRGRHRNNARIVSPQEGDSATGAEWTKRAMTTMTARFVPNAKDPSSIRVKGPCPNCDHPMTWDSPLTIIRTDIGVSRWWLRGPTKQFLAHEGLRKIILTPQATEFSMKCRCGKKGRDHEAGSCKAVWNMRVARPQ